ncbi:MAG: hypothetical protein ACTHMW_15365 [Actinomycetes bacterium]
MFGIDMSLEHPASFLLAAVVTAVGVSLMGYLLAEALAVWH